jgi:hypothetical protein
MVPSKTPDDESVGIRARLLPMSREQSAVSEQSEMPSSSVVVYTVTASIEIVSTLAPYDTSRLCIAGPTSDTPETRLATRSPVCADL